MKILVKDLIWIVFIISNKYYYTENVCGKKHDFNQSWNKITYGHNIKYYNHYSKIGHTIDMCHQKRSFYLGHKFHKKKNFLPLIQ